MDEITKNKWSEENAQTAEGDSVQTVVRDLVPGNGWEKPYRARNVWEHKTTKRRVIVMRGISRVMIKDDGKRPESVPMTHHLYKDCMKRNGGNMRRSALAFANLF